MSSLSMVEAKLPPGFRFHPRDDELICDYLMKRFSSSETDSSLLIEVDLNKCEPWDIPEIACIGGKEWYFYSQRDRKYATGLRTNRATASGYWKATGKDRAIARKESLVGMRKTLVFYQGRAPHGKKTEWVMHEYRLEGPFGPPKLLSSKEDWVLCRVFHKTTEVAAKPPTSTPNPNPNPNTTTCCDVQTTSSSSGLPPLMDSYITFDQTPQDDHDNDNNNSNNSNNNDNAYQQVPCFSIFNQNQVNQPNPPSSFSHLFNTMEPTTSNPTTMLPYHNTPGFQDAVLTSATTNTATNDSNAMSSLSTSDKSMIKAVLSHLTKMGGSHAMKGSSPTSLGEAGSSESYLSDVGLPTMWTTHY